MFPEGPSFRGIFSKACMISDGCYGRFDPDHDTFTLFDIFVYYIITTLAPIISTAVVGLFRGGGKIFRQMV